MAVTKTKDDKGFTTLSVNGLEAWLVILGLLLLAFIAGALIF